MFSRPVRISLHVETTRETLLTPDRHGSGAYTANIEDDDQQTQQHQQQHHQQQPRRGRLPARIKLAPELQIPKNRSTGNLAMVAESDSDVDEPKPRFRFSFDAGAVGPDSAKRYVLQQQKPRISGGLPSLLGGHVHKTGDLRACRHIPIYIYLFGSYCFVPVVAVTTITLIH